MEVMEVLLFLLVFFSNPCQFYFQVFNYTKPTLTLASDDPEENKFFLPATVSSFSSIAGIIVVGCLIYYCLIRKKRTEGFSQFTDENDSTTNDSSTRNFRWNNRRFFRRNRRQNPFNNNRGPRHDTHVVIQPVVNMGFPSVNVHATSSVDESGTVSAMSAAPPPYVDPIYNPIIRGNLNNPLQMNLDIPPCYTKY